VSGGISLMETALDAQTSDSSTSKKMSALKFGAKNLRAFVGTGNADSNNDGVVDDPSVLQSNGDMGMAVTIDQMALVVMTPEPAGTATVDATGKVTGVTITSPGSGYTSANPPTVTFSAPTSGVTATGTATVDATGKVTGVTITNPGSGYTSANPPTFTFSTQSYFALKASGSAQLIGINDVTLSGKLNIDINRARDSAAPNSAAAAINFQASAAANQTEYGAATGLTVRTGPGANDFEIIDFTQDTLNVSGLVSLGISQFVFATGNFAFAKTSDA